MTEDVLAANVGQDSPHASYIRLNGCTVICRTRRYYDLNKRTYPI